MANIELLDKVLNHIQAQPYTWDQDVWRTFGNDTNFKTVTDDNKSKDVLAVDCGTSFCFAGWACQLSNEPAEWHSKTTLYANEADIEQHGDEVDTAGGFKVIEPGYRAQRLLGLDNDQAEAMFAEGRTMEELENYIEQIKAGVEGKDIIDLED